MPRRRPPAQTAPSNRTSELIKRIEAIIAEGIAEPLSRDPPRPLSLPLCTRKRSSREVMVAASITFPGRTEAEARKFSTLLPRPSVLVAEGRHWRYLTGPSRSDTTPLEEHPHSFEDRKGAHQEVRCRHLVQRSRPTNHGWRGVQKPLLRGD
ncbi:hypothetical protein VUR80DRAFT_5965 [Thermomyces stellatus]